MKFVALGLAIGVLSGILGLGGGIFLVPALIYLFDFTPHQAQGTSLGVLIPPIGIFAAMEYWRKGLIDVSVVGLICAGFVFGAFAGAFFVDRIPVPLMRRLFGFFLFFVAVQLVFTSPERRVAAVFPAVAATAVLGLVYSLERRLGIVLPRLRRWLEHRRPRPPIIDFQI
jgi:hypothetical protein